MNIGFSNPGVWAYGASAAAFAWIAFRLIANWHPGGKPALLLATALSTVAAALAGIAFAALPTVGFGWIAAFLDFVRVALAVSFILALLGVRKTASTPRGGHELAPLLGLAIVLLLAWLLVGVKPPGVLDRNPVTRQLGFGVGLGVAVFALMLIEQCYRRTPAGARWHIRPLVIGLAGLFAFDLALFADALLFGVMSLDLWAARGFAQALTVPLIAATLRRRSDWSFQLAVSRGVVTGSTALVLSGAYLLVVAGAGFLLRQLGGSWGHALESVVIFAALLLMAVIGLSATFRARVRVFVSKHFFTYRYDYREAWLRLTATLSTGAAGTWSATIQALADLVDSPGGALWIRSAEHGYRQVDRHTFPASENAVPADDPLPRFLRKSGWILELKDVKARPEAYEGVVVPADIAEARDAWLIVPLVAAQDLVGFVVLTTPRAPIDVDWEVHDLLKTAGRQAASYLAYAQATEALLESQKFDAFHRMSTFVVHDLKNLIAQLQLLLSNAERHRDNPDFQRDMMKTIEHVVGRMHQLTLQLRPEASGRDRAEPVDVGAIARRVQSLRAAGRRGLTVEAADGAYAWAHQDLLERVISHLVQNAFDASDAQPDVKVRVAVDGDQVVVEVSDRGKGMSAEFVREHLFKPFHTTKSTGMGIGAFECQQYVRQIGGRMDVRSAPGEGTVVSVRLPAVAPVGAAVELQA